MKKWQRLYFMFPPMEYVHMKLEEKTYNGSISNIKVYQNIVIRTCFVEAYSYLNSSYQVHEKRILSTVLSR